MMATPQQPPPDDWQPPPPPGSWQQQPPPGTGFPPDVSAQPWQPGSQYPRAGYAEPVLTADMIPVKRRRGWIITAAVLVLAAGGFFIQHSVSSQAKGHLVLPGSLLGLRKNTSSAARYAAYTLKKREMQGAGGKLEGVVATVYGSPPATWSQCREAACAGAARPIRPVS
jgi:hypothetical protein